MNWAIFALDLPSALPCNRLELQHLDERDARCFERALELLDLRTG